MGLTKPKITGGVELPELGNPASAANIQSGYEAVDGSGNKITGTHTEASLTDLLPALSNPAGAANIQSGYNAVNNAGAVVTGTATIAKDFHEIIEFSKTSSSRKLYFTQARVTRIAGLVTEYQNSTEHTYLGYIDGKQLLTPDSTYTLTLSVSSKYIQFDSLMKKVVGTLFIFNDADKTAL